MKKKKKNVKYLFGYLRKKIVAWHNIHFQTHHNKNFSLYFLLSFHFTWKGKKTPFFFILSYSWKLCLEKRTHKRKEIFREADKQKRKRWLTWRKPKMKMVIFIVFFPGWISILCVLGIFSILSPQPTTLTLKTTIKRNDDDRMSWRVKWISILVFLDIEKIRRVRGIPHRDFVRKGEREKMNELLVAFFKYCLVSGF